MRHPTAGIPGPYTSRTVGKAIISGNVTLKTTGEIDAMRAAGRLCAQALAAVSAAIKPGVTTLDLDTIAEAHRQMERNANAGKIVVVVRQ